MYALYRELGHTVDLTDPRYYHLDTAPAVKCCTLGMRG
ncbi:hypothetical protein SMF913_25349 [Streptomyces malaysiensis]|uniref:Uncharacterized protein n=1 Tax=Streptomyces malaysiensis TaxID=92644 RepID=A0A2J7YPC5_STRMQ|nr:hypothetical protein SMF913_25349 [Streptomyces malaysiensis]